MVDDRVIINIFSEENVYQTIIVTKNVLLQLNSNYFRIY